MPSATLVLVFPAPQHPLHLAFLLSVLDTDVRQRVMSRPVILIINEALFGLLSLRYGTKRIYAEDWAVVIGLCICALAFYLTATGTTISHP